MRVTRTAACWHGLLLTDNILCDGGFVPASGFAKFLTPPSSATLHTMRSGTLHLMIPALMIIKAARAQPAGKVSLGALQACCPDLWHGQSWLAVRPMFRQGHWHEACRHRLTIALPAVRVVHYTTALSEILTSHPDIAPNLTAHSSETGPQTILNEGGSHASTDPSTFSRSK